ncbi:MAG: hypothetical protein K0S22_449 [Oscillospiraceae bacterium]|jgi:alcohol dehydrogenase class IV|nr:hypothetical protein [Oscillospiraceae bacterium]
MDDFFQLATAKILIAGPDDAEALLTQAALAGRVLLLATNSALLRCNLTDLPDIVVKNQGMHIFDSLSANPNIKEVLMTLEAIGRFSPSKIIAIGGGSTIDMAKAVSALRNTTSELTCASLGKSIREKLYLRQNQAVPILALPTTAGTGSEVTSWATVWDTDGKLKLSVEAPFLCPECAVLVPEYTAKMSPLLTITTGLDALAQAIEAFWAKRRNAASQALAAAAVKKIFHTLPAVVHDGGNLALRRTMCEASLLSGLAFATTRTTACHSISYPLTLRYQIPHGLAAAITLAPVAKRNIAAVPETEELLAIFGGAQGLGLWIDALCGLHCTLRLSAFKIQKQEIGQIASETFTLGRMDNNPVLLTKENVEHILEEIF